MQTVPESKCPRCNHILDAVAEDYQPEPDDYTVCQYCMGVLKFNESLQLIDVPEKEIPPYIWEQREKFIAFKRAWYSERN